MDDKILKLFKLDDNGFKNEKYLKIHYGTSMPKMELIEDELALRKNPLLVIPEHFVGKFLSESGDCERNPYGYRPYDKKYFLYHRFVDVEHIMFGDNKINRIILIERDENNQLIENNFVIFIVMLF